MHRSLAIVPALLLLFVAAAARAEIRTEVVEYQVAGKPFKGLVAWDDASSAKRPGVLVVPEWWGCNDYAMQRAKDLAALGYVGFACDMYGEARTTTDPKQAGAWAGEVYGDPAVLRARAEAGLAQLAGFRLTNPDKLAAIGFCFGGAVALEMARLGADLDAVACFHGGLTPKGAAVAPGAIKAEILVLNGAEDPMVAAADRAAFMDEMRKSGARWTFVELGGAVHAFSNPGAGKPGASPTGIQGVAHDERAEKQSWGMLKELLARTLE